MITGPAKLATGNWQLSLGISAVFGTSDNPPPPPLKATLESFYIDMGVVMAFSTPVSFACSTFISG